MPNIESVDARLKTLEERFLQFLDNSVEPKDGTIVTDTTDDTLFPIQTPGQPVQFVKKSDFLTVILGGVRQITNTTSEVTEVGQIAIGQKDGINGGRFFIGQVSFFPPTENSHITFKYREL